MKVWTFFLACFIFFALPLNTFADSKITPMQTLADKANDIYEAISNNKIDTAVDDLVNFKKTWENISSTDSRLSAVAERTIRAQVGELDQLLKQDVSTDELNEASVEFRLAVDALVNSGHPLWLGMRDKVLQSFDKVEKDVHAGDDRAFQVDLNQFLDVYQLVYPSMTIDIKSDVLKELDAQMNHLINNRMIILQDPASHFPHLTEIHHDLDQLFGGTETTSGKFYAPGWITPSIFIGGLTILTLLYVVWRKYKGEDEARAQISVTKR
ncbi:MAG: sporulation protein YpjB [Tuberibacillus sp.]